MPIARERPYAQFNFLVDIGNGETEGPEAGFQECSQIATSVDVIEYRNGNDRETSPRKLTGLTRVADVTLRRGIIGSGALYDWLLQTGRGEPSALRTVEIHLQSEDRAATVMSWRLHNARVVRLAHGPLHARGTDVAIEELTLACERIEIG